MSETAQRKDQKFRNSAEEDAKLTEYTVEYIENQNKSGKTWVVLYGRVYDVSEFKIDHPGGPDVLSRKKTRPTGEDYYEIDATTDFENVFHTKQARMKAKGLLVGKVKGAKLGDLFQAIDSNEATSTTMATSETGASTLNTLVTLSFLMLAALFAYQFYIKK